MNAGNPSRSRSMVLKGLLCCALAVLSLGYLVKGYRNLILTPGDLHRRWTECRFVLHGQDPFQIFLHQYHAPDAAKNEAECDRLRRIYGTPEEPVYPPWAYAPAMLFVWAPWQMDVYYYLLIDTACIAILVTCALVIARPATQVDKVAVALATLAIASICTTLGNGNFGLIVTAAVLLSVFFDQRDRPFAGGIFFWIAMVKPTVSLPFALVFLLQNRWKSMIVAAGLCAVSCLFPWIVDRVNPLEMMHEAVVVSQHFQGGGYGIVNWLPMLGVPDHHVTSLAAALTLIPAAIFFFFNPSLPVWKNLAILAVVGRFWAYHMAHDNIMLFFLACAVWRIFLKEMSLASTAVLLLVGASLWLPSSFTELGDVPLSRRWIHHTIGIVQHVIWLAGAGYVWRSVPSQGMVPNGPTVVCEAASDGAV